MGTSRNQTVPVKRFTLEWYQISSKTVFNHVFPDPRLKNHSKGSCEVAMLIGPPLRMKISPDITGMKCHSKPPSRDLHRF